MKGKNQGFMLVELVVVLAILAIMAAIVLPALTSFIEEARRKTCIAQARQTFYEVQLYMFDQCSQGNMNRYTVGALSGLKLNDKNNPLSEYFSGGQKDAEIVGLSVVLKTGHVYRLVYRADGYQVIIDEREEEEVVCEPYP